MLKVNPIAMAVFLGSFYSEKCIAIFKVHSMKDKKEKQINVRLSESHLLALQKFVDEGKAKSQSGALVYLVNQYMIMGK